MPFPLIGSLIGKIAGKVAGGAGGLADLPGALSGKLGGLSALAKPLLGDNGLSQLSNLKNNISNYTQAGQNAGEETAEIGHRNALHTTNMGMRHKTELSLLKLADNLNDARNQIWDSLGKSAKEITRN